MDRIIHALDLACELIIVAGLIVLLGSLAYIGFNNGNSSMDNLSYYYNKDKYFEYNGSVIDGSTAVYLAESAAADNDVLVKFYTKTCSDGFVSINGIKDITSDYYIDPSVSFLCNAVKDLNDTVVALQIIEVGTNMFATSEANLVAETAKLKKANEILEDKIRVTESSAKAALLEDLTGVSIDVNSRQEYKSFTYYLKMKEFYDEWRAAM